MDDPVPLEDAVPLLGALDVAGVLDDPPVDEDVPWPMEVLDAIWDVPMEDDVTMAWEVPLVPCELVLLSGGTPLVALEELRGGPDREEDVEGAG